MPLGPDSTRHTTLSLLKRAKMHIKVSRCPSRPHRPGGTPGPEDGLRAAQQGLRRGPRSLVGEGLGRSGGRLDSVGCREGGWAVDRPPRPWHRGRLWAGIGVGFQELAVGCGLSEMLPGAGSRGLRTEGWVWGATRVGLALPQGSPGQGLDGTQLVPWGPHGEAAALCPGRRAEGGQGGGRRIVQAECHLSWSARPGLGGAVPGSRTTRDLVWSSWLVAVGLLGADSRWSAQGRGRAERRGASGLWVPPSVGALGSWCVCGGHTPPGS